MPTLRLRHTQWVSTQKIWSSFKPHGKNMEQLFKVEVLLSLSTPGELRVLTFLEWFRGGEKRKPSPWASVLPPQQLTRRFFLNSLLIQPLLGCEGASCFGCEKSIAITGWREKDREPAEEGERLLSLSVRPCLTAVISLNCFANIIPTQPGSRSARPLSLVLTGGSPASWSHLPPLLPPFSSPRRLVSIRIKNYKTQCRRDDPSFSRNPSELFYYR